MKNVVITGIGLATPLGLGREKCWNELMSARSAVKPDKEYPGILSARVENLNVPSETRLLSMGFLAAAEAMTDAGIDFSVQDPSRFANTVSTSKPNLAIASSADIFISEYFLQSTLTNQISKILKLKGPQQNITAACATGAGSVVLGARWIESGACDMAICGAAESSFHPFYVAGFKKMGVLAKSRVSPFSRRREGFAMGEGAGVLVLERKELAVMRGAKNYGEISGWSMSCETKSAVSFDPAGSVIAYSIKQALGKAKMDFPDYINAHGTGTILNDVTETNAIKKALGKKTRNVSVSSTKAATGHLLGASGAVELIFSLLAMRDHAIPPTLNLHEPDPECDLDYTPNVPVFRTVDGILSLSFGFGGQIAVLAVKR
ncbi:MAG: beta-ketoacyl-[acyl-carrier-protein] synthase family protein [Endomicrobiales bacterium]|nr:beta-ketoacyl-[acyl-carrier-protein] synthase family protein [Endomicrobiales bacterium]